VSAVLEVREASARNLTTSQPDALQQLDSLSTAPGGVARLRELIRALAVQGRLLGQSEPRSADLPPDWTWKRLGDLVASSEAGWSPSCPEQPRREGRWGILKVSAVSWGEFDAAANKELPLELQPRPQYEVQHGDFLLSRANTAELVARSVVVKNPPPRLLLSDKIIRLKLKQEVDAEYLNLVNNSSAARSHYQALASGTSASMKNVSREVVLALPVPLPPLAEQARIVARVDELMRLCDALEEKGRLEAEQHARLLSTLLGTLTDSATPEELAANWQRVAEHFDLLLDRPEAVDALEQVILELAVRGLLVPQHPADEPASVLMATISRDRQRLERGGQLSGRTLEVTDSDSPDPFPVPATWLWVSFGQYVHEVCTGPFGSLIHKGDYVPGGVPLINPSHMIGGKVCQDPNVALAPDRARELAAYRLSAGDVLMARRGEVGRYAIVGEREEGWLCGTGSFFVRLAPNCDRDYFGLMLEDPRFRRDLLGESVGATMVNLNQRILLRAKLAIPPLAEQARIVARVAELRSLCATLRQRLQAQQATQSRLAEALVEQALAG
jgi:type I restriction enzyme S subunit